MEAESLTSRAGQDVVSCCSWSISGKWAEIISQTSVYVGENSRTDTIDGFVLARLLCFRTEGAYQNELLPRGQPYNCYLQEDFPGLAPSCCLWGCSRCPCIVL